MSRFLPTICGKFEKMGVLGGRWYAGNLVLMSERIEALRNKVRK